jgi:hypothetical protein
MSRYFSIALVSLTAPKEILKAIKLTKAIEKYLLISFLLLI